MNTGVTARQAEVLAHVVQEYVRTAVPVSSHLIESRYMQDLSSATIRNEMRVLEEAGLLLQPHTSAGRIPTEEGYRAIVEGLAEASASIYSGSLMREQRLLHRALRRLAVRSSSLALAYLAGQELVWKEGWEDLLSAPEFSDRATTLSFMRFLQDVERGFGTIEQEGGLRIFIGRHNPFSRVGGFSILVASFRAEDEEEGSGLVALVGPMRMAYERNAGLLCRLGREMLE